MTKIYFIIATNGTINVPQEPRLVGVLYNRHHLLNHLELANRVNRTS